MEESVDQGRVFVALLTDPSKAFDRFSHKLLIAKMACLGLTSRKQRTKISNTYSSCQEILSSTTRFNTWTDDIANYADDNTPHLSEKNVV